jgi:hypothetical protein
VGLTLPCVDEVREPIVYLEYLLVISKDLMDIYLTPPTTNVPETGPTRNDMKDN